MKERFNKLKCLFQPGNRIVIFAGNFVRSYKYSCYKSDATSYK